MSASSCSTPPESEFVPTARTFTALDESPASASPLSHNWPNRPLTLEAAIARAIASNSEIALLHAAEDIALQERRAATDWDDPQFSAAWGQGSGDTFHEDWSSQQTLTRTSGRQRSSETQRDFSLVPDDASTIRRTTTAESSSGTTRQSSSEYTSGTSSDDDDSYRLGLRFFVPNPWLLTARVSAGKAQMQAARSDRLAMEWFTAREVHRLFLEINYLTNDLALASTAVSLHDTILKTVRERAEQTGATGADVLKATQARMRSASERDRTRKEAALALRELSDLLNLPARAVQIDASSATNISPNLALISRDEIETYAMRSREDLTALYWRMRAAEQLYREARNEGIPWFSHIDASYSEGHQRTTGSETSSGSGTGSGSFSQSSSGQGSVSNLGPGGSESAPTSLRSEQRETTESDSSRRTETGTGTSSDSEDSSEWQVGFMVNVPIFTWFVNNADDVMLAEYKLASAQYAEHARQVSRDVHNACDEFEEAQREWTMYAATEGPFLMQVRQSLQSIEATTELPPDDVAGIKLEIVDALRLWRDARRRLRETVVQLERAAGVSFNELRRPVETIAPAAP